MDNGRKRERQESGLTPQPREAVAGETTIRRMFKRVAYSTQPQTVRHLRLPGRRGFTVM